MFSVTERLLLQPGWIDDAPALTKAVANQKIVRNLAMLPWPYNQSDAESFLTNVHGKGVPEFLIFTREGTPELIGGIGLHADQLKPDSVPELGYWIAETRWGQGFATEAGRAVINIARWTLKLPRLTSGHFIDNPASGRVLEKLGFSNTNHVVQRYSAGRGEAVACQLMTLRLAEEKPAPPMRWASQQMQMAA